MSASVDPMARKGKSIMMTVKVWMKLDSCDEHFEGVENTGIEGPFYWLTKKGGDIRHLIPIADIYRIKEVDDDCDDDE